MPRGTPLPSPSPSLGSQASPASSMSLKSLLHTPLAEPDLVVWLRDLTLDMTTSHKPHQNVRFELAVCRKHPKAQLSVEAESWTHSRPFSDYSALRKNLLRELQPGHNCSAECKWLYTVVKQHFPKTQMTFALCSLKTERRRAALLRAMTTIQSTLVTHGNRGCKVLMGGVLNTFSTFLVGDRVSLSSSTSPALPSRQGLLGLPSSLGRRLASLRSLARVRAR
ncbi:uncharacterized protein IUM83_13697 [Phytophthora cinnamomi]|uniref:uncharacterized protein n=1 Tax=Phytophthora cinnamomi TaxID=4785 RepID=UPI0035595E9F|nr:hypothetical protein IUM83_13697 [Phytophthora cinnamomi]